MRLGTGYVFSTGSVIAGVVIRFPPSELRPARCGGFGLVFFLNRTPFERGDHAAGQISKQSAQLDLFIK
jgi:hypothetical protein